jgi:hypothetical protein
LSGGTIERYFDLKNHPVLQLKNDSREIRGRVASGLRDAVTIVGDGMCCTDRRMTRALPELHVPSTSTTRMRRLRERRKVGEVVLRPIKITEEFMEWLTRAHLLDPWCEDHEQIALAVERASFSVRRTNDYDHCAAGR